MRALYTAATGMSANQFSLDVIANNLANVNTNGYKRTSTHFSDLLYENLRSPGAPLGSGAALPTGSQVGLGVAPGTTSRSFSQGTIKNTGDEYDIAVQGEGMLQVMLPGGTTGYTRDGHLSLDRDGNLVTQEGYQLYPQITIPSDKQTCTIQPDGTVSITQQGQPQATTLGQIKVYRFLNYAGLEAAGGNIFKESAASGAPSEIVPGEQGMGTILQQALEMPNVEVVDQMIQMITVQRAYETNSKAVMAADEMLQQANAIKR